MKKNKNNAEIVAEILSKDATLSGKDIPNYYQEWLQWLIEIFSLDNLLKNGSDYNKILSTDNSNNEIFRECLKLWVKTALEYQQRHECTDFFGEVYEWCFQSKSKAARLQQYFTPYEIGSLMARCLNNIKIEEDVIFNSEPSCGSGRNLLALWQEADWNKKHIWYAEDLDPVSVKMCALNMMINGMFGWVVCHNTLLPDDFIFGYAVNEVRYPIPCNFFSIRPITRDEYDSVNPWPGIASENMDRRNETKKFSQSLFDFEDE